MLLSSPLKSHVVRLFNVKSSPESKGDPFSSQEPELSISEGAPVTSSDYSDVM